MHQHNNLDLARAMIDDHHRRADTRLLQTRTEHKVPKPRKRRIRKAGSTLLGIVRGLAARPSPGRAPGSRDVTTQPL